MFYKKYHCVAVFKELIHTAQHRKGEIDGSVLSIACAEVKAKTKLLENDKMMYESLLGVD